MIKNESIRFSSGKLVWVMLEWLRQLLIIIHFSIRWNDVINRSQLSIMIEPRKPGCIASSTAQKVYLSTCCVSEVCPWPRMFNFGASHFNFFTLDLTPEFLWAIDLNIGMPHTMNMCVQQLLASASDWTRWDDRPTLIANLLQMMGFLWGGFHFLAKVAFHNVLV